MKELIAVNGAKPKSIIIDGDLHSRFKMLCKGKNLKIGGVIEDLIRAYLHDPNGMQQVINAVRGEIDEVAQRKYITEALNKK
jgi:hypothetical protein